MADIFALAKDMAKRTGRNPQTGKEIQIKRKNLDLNSDEQWERKRPGRTKYSNIVLKRAMTLLRLAEKFKESNPALAKKFYDKGNSAAGTRVRKVMQEMKTIGQDLKKEVTSTKTLGHEAAHVVQQIMQKRKAKFKAGSELADNVKSAVVVEEVVKPVEEVAAVCTEHTLSKDVDGNVLGVVDIEGKFIQCHSTHL